MIRSLGDVSRIAEEKGPKKLAVLAPEDEEFMRAVKKSCELGYIEPILIGNTKKIEQAAEKVAFNISPFQKISGDEHQGISDLGIRMLFSGEVPIAGKGQITTSYIYRSIIREEAKAGSGMTVSVMSLWEAPGIDHLIAFTDSGVNIKPDLKAKGEIIKNAVFVYHLLGYPRPKIAVLSGQREVGGKLTSYKDYEALQKAADVGDFGPCEIQDGRRVGDEKPMDELLGFRDPSKEARWVLAHGQRFNGYLTLISLTWEALSRHFLVDGTQGSGKTTSFFGHIQHSALCPWIYQDSKAELPFRDDFPNTCVWGLDVRGHESRSGVWNPLEEIRSKEDRDLLVDYVLPSNHHDANPSFRQLVHQLVDLCLCSDVNSSGWFIQQQNF